MTMMKSTSPLKNNTHLNPPLFYKALVSLHASVLFLTLLGCGKTHSPSQPQSPKKKLYELEGASLVIENIGKNVILKTYQDLESQTKKLALAIEKLKTDPTQENLLFTQKAWREARVPWESSESFLFGPVESLGLDPMLDTWPLAISDLERVLVLYSPQSSSPLNKEMVRNFDTNLQGFHAIEYLLFGDGTVTPGAVMPPRTGILIETPKNIRDFSASEFHYLTFLIEVMLDHTRSILRAWQDHHDPDDSDSPPFLELFTLKSNTTRRGFTNTPQVFLTIIQDGMAAIADELANGKLATPLGDSTESADSSLVESQFSWNSLSDFQNNMDSMIALYTGDYGNHFGEGIDVLLRQVDPDLDQEILREMIHAKHLIADIAGSENLSFTAAIYEPAARDRVVIAIQQVNTLAEILRYKLLNWIN